MRKHLNKLYALFNKACQKTAAKAIAIQSDIAGSDTTEKLGMVAIAVFVIAVAYVAVEKFMPGMFKTIFGKANSKLNDIMSGADSVSLD